MLVEERLKTSTFAELNDPFELHGDMSKEVTPEEILSYLNVLHRRSPLPEPPSLKIAKLLLPHAAIRSEDNEVFQRIRDDRDKINRVLCFSERNTNTLMWAHYGDNNKGAAVGFRSEFFERSLVDKWLFKMSYGDRPKVRHIYAGSLSENELLSLAQTKAKEWEYEQEWRLNVKVTHLIAGGDESMKMLFLPVRSSAIDSIIFGLQCPNRIKDECKLLCRNRSSLGHVKFFQTRMDGHRSDLILDRI